MSRSHLACFHPFSKAGTFIPDGCLSVLLSDTPKSLHFKLFQFLIIFTVRKLSWCLSQSLFSLSPECLSQYDKQFVIFLLMLLMYLKTNSMSPLVLCLVLQAINLQLIQPSLLSTSYQVLVHLSSLKLTTRFFNIHSILCTYSTFTNFGIVVQHLLCHVVHLRLCYLYIIVCTMHTLSRLYIIFLNAFCLRR